MRALHFLPVYAPAWHFGGPILSVSRLCEGLAIQGVDVRVITTNAGLPDFPDDQLGIPQSINGIQVFYYPVDHTRGMIRSRRLVESLAQHMDWADILHLSSIWQPLGIPVQKAAHSAGVPVLQTLRGALGPYSWRRGWWKKVPYFLVQELPLLQQADGIHCTTIQEAREIKWLRLQPSVHLLPNPMDLAKLHYSPELGERWRKSIGLSSDETVLLVAGRLHHKKGLDFLLYVLKEIEHLSWKIVFLGEDDDGTGYRLKNRFRQIGLANRCVWLDSIPADQLIGPYNTAHCLLLPSRHENFGNVVLESLVCGCAVLISDRVGASSMISHCAGVHVAPHNPQLWITLLKKILLSPKPGSRTNNTVINRFSKKQVAEEAISIYREIIQRRHN